MGHAHAWFNAECGEIQTGTRSSLAGAAWRANPAQAATDILQVHHQRAFFGCRAVHVRVRTSTNTALVSPPVHSGSEEVRAREKRPAAFVWETSELEMYTRYMDDNRWVRSQRAPGAVGHSSVEERERALVDCSLPCFARRLSLACYFPCQALPGDASHTSTIFALPNGSLHK